MTQRMRYGIAALCVAALAGLVGLFVSADNSAAANGVFGLAMIVLLCAGVVGLALVLLETLRPTR